MIALVILKFYFVMTSPEYACLSPYVCNLQLVIERVRMKGPWIQELAHVAVQVASVGTTVKVSAMHA